MNNNLTISTTTFIKKEVIGILCCIELISSRVELIYGKNNQNMTEKFISDIQELGLRCLREIGAQIEDIESSEKELSSLSQDEIEYKANNSQFKILFDSI